MNLSGVIEFIRGNEYIEIFYFTYVLILSILTILYLLLDLVIGKLVKNKKIDKSNHDKLVNIFFSINLGLLFCFLAIGTLIIDFTKNIVTQVPLLILSAFLFYAIILKKARITKFLNAEISYNELKVTVEYLEDTVKKKQVESDLISIALETVNDNTTKPGNANDSWFILDNMLKGGNTDDVFKFNLDKMRSLPNEATFRNELISLFNTYTIWYDDKKLDEVINRLQTEKIALILKDKIYLVYLEGQHTYKQVALLKNSEPNKVIDNFDATAVLNLGKILY